MLLVPECEAVVEPWRARFDPRAAQGVPAHVTVLYPWLPADGIGEPELAALKEIAGRHAPFELVFSRIGRWPDGMWLGPADGEPVRRLTADVVARWPEYPPYRGDPDADTQPHLTLAMGADPELMQPMVDDLAAKLPVRAAVDRLTLVDQGPDGRWRLRAALPLG